MYLSNILFGFSWFPALCSGTHFFNSALRYRSWQVPPVPAFHRCVTFCCVNTPQSLWCTPVGGVWVVPFFLFAVAPGAAVQTLMHGPWCVDARVSLRWLFSGVWPADPFTLLKITEGSQRPFLVWVVSRSVLVNVKQLAFWGKTSPDCSVCWFLWPADPTLITTVFKYHWGVEPLGEGMWIDRYKIMLSWFPEWWASVRPKAVPERFCVWCSHSLIFAYQTGVKWQLTVSWLAFPCGPGLLTRLTRKALHELPPISCSSLLLQVSIQTKLLTSRPLHMLFPPWKTPLCPSTEPPCSRLPSSGPSAGPGMGWRVSKSWIE